MEKKLIPPNLWTTRNILMIIPTLIITVPVLGILFLFIQLGELAEELWWITSPYLPQLKYPTIKNNNENSSNKNN
jgi:hypothetical protein